MVKVIRECCNYSNAGLVGPPHANFSNFTKSSIMSNPRILSWDLESTNLNASFGTILAIGWKWLDQKKVYVPTILETNKKGMLDDQELVRQFSNVYNEADAAVTWYGSRFDLPFVQTKLIKYGLPPLKPVPEIDLWKTAKYRLKLHSNRLATVSEYLGVEHRKTPISFDAWMRAAQGDKKALSEVKEHCRLDVLVLEEVFLKLRPLVREEPSWYLGMVCPSCGSAHLQSRGTYPTKTRRYKRVQCQSCGTWSRSRKCEKVEAPELVK